MRAFGLTRIPPTFTHCGGTGRNWLAGEDSNLHSRLQRPVSYHWTTGQQDSSYDITPMEFTRRNAVGVRRLVYDMRGFDAVRGEPAGVWCKSDYAKKRTATDFRGPPV